MHEISAHAETNKEEYLAKGEFIVIRFSFVRISLEISGH